MSTILMATRSTPTQFSVLVGISPLRIMHTSSEVPPMSMDSKLRWSIDCPTYRAPVGAAAGPELIRKTARGMQCSTVSTNPLDSIMRRFLLKPESRNLFSRARR
ncbi:MAG TPA: hypothetical protein VJM80_13420 [bacterium]|nr:hypothetical protein [bacterium]